MKTVILWQDVPEDSYWIAVDGDKRHWDKIFINQCGKENIQEEMTEESFNKEGVFLHEKITREEAESLVRGGAFLITCGFIL